MGNDAQDSRDGRGDRAQEAAVDPETFCSLYPGIEADLRAALNTLPERLSGHRVLAEIGAGGMGRVFLAMDERLGRRVAIKTLNERYRDDPGLRSRFMQEARAMARLNHPHVARIYHLGEADEIPHFVMEYLEGTSLTQAARALTLRQKVELMRKVALAVDFLHQHGIVHRDLKPGNILVGADLEPKVLDFGVARQVDGESGLTLVGQRMGTPDYFSPEQAEGQALDPRSDVFSLGVILYELLTGQLPFEAETLEEQLRSIRTQDPVLPRRLNGAIPGDLQNVCMKAVEKTPSERYASAREMAGDLERFLAGEPVMAAPSSYARLMSGRIEQHLAQLDHWRQDRILSDYEFDAFRRLYDRLVEREDAWIMEMRRFGTSQVALYLGAWLLVVGAALIVLFHYDQLTSARGVIAVNTACAITGWLGIRRWKQGRQRVGVAYLLALCLVLPVALLVGMHEWGLLGTYTKGDDTLELFYYLEAFKRTTHAQIWWALLLSLPFYVWLRRFTRSSVFSLVFAVMAALLCVVTLLRMGMIEWLDTDPGRVYFRLLPFALAFFAAGRLLERLHHTADSRYFYPIAVGFTLVGLSGVAAVHEPYAEWLESAFPVTRGQVEYLFMVNALVYFGLQSLFGRFPSAQMRGVAQAFRFVIPGHVLGGILLLGLAATEMWDASPADAALRTEARVFEIALPVVACLFVFGSVSRQMKNYLASGLVFLAIGIVRLQQNLFQDRAVWPLILLLSGLLVMWVSTHYSPLKMGLLRLAGRRRAD